MDANDVASYLKQNPQFFEDYADLMAGIFVPHPHGGHAIPIAERQILALREKTGDLEAKMRDLMRYGAENDAIGEKLHRLTLALFGAADLDTTLAVLYQSLQEDFGVPQVGARLWGRGLQHSYLPELAAASEELCAYAGGLSTPYCGPNAPFEARNWFETPEACASFAYLPLRTSQTFGLLALASDDPQRFVPDMGTVYLTRLGELASVATSRYLPPV